ncbi:MAG: PQQ-dependent sugar dehydrogenase [Actinobacteria bacterium]|nr:PQQ-dependent sugar dehydrogenase [Actinomycetota bacterium]
MGKLIRAVISLIVLISMATLPLSGCRSPERGDVATPQTTGLASSGKLPAKISGLESPVAMAFSPDGRIFITERSGRIRIFKDGKLEPQPFTTVDVPKLSGYNETGLLGITLDPNFSKSPFVYFYRSFEENGRLFNRVMRARDERGKGVRLETILDKIPGGRIHNGGVIGFGPDGNLYITTGETGKGELAQDKSSLAGKILRIKPDGSIPKDNPFRGSPVYSLGHRNVFGLAFNPRNNRLYTTENGPESDDEINVIKAGGNYGWPIVLGFSNDPRFINPIKAYTPQVAPTQALFYTGNLFPDSKGDFFFGSFLEGTIHRLKLGGTNQDKVLKDDIVYTDPARQGIVGIAQAPDGSIYAITKDGIARIDRLI